jgi:hypothetical protein
VQALDPVRHTPGRDSFDFLDLAKQSSIFEIAPVSFFIGSG